MVGREQVSDFHVVVFPRLQLSVELVDLPGEYFVLFEVGKAVVLELEDVEEGVEVLGFVGEGDGLRLPVELHLFVLEFGVVLVLGLGEFLH